MRIEIDKRSNETERLKNKEEEKIEKDQKVEEVKG